MSDKRKSLGVMYERLRDLGNRLLRSTQARWGGGLYRITYPSYKDRTSRHHPLRGWILIEFGYAEPLSCPDLLEAKTHRAYEALALNR